MPKEFSSQPFRLKEKVATFIDTPRLTRRILNELPITSETTTQAGREVMLRMLHALPLETVDPKQLTHGYADAVDKLNEDSNVKGPVKDMISAGFIVGKHIPKDVEPYREITASWRRVIPMFKEQPAWQSVGPTYLELEEAIRPRQIADITNYSSKKLLDEYNNGYSSRTIAAHLGVPPEIVLRGLNRLKILGLLPAQPQPRTTSKEQ